MHWEFDSIVNFYDQSLIFHNIEGWVEQVSQTILTSPIRCSWEIKIGFRSPVNLIQLVGHALYMQGSEFEFWSFHLSTLRVEFLATRLFDQKNKLILEYKIDFNIFEYFLIKYLNVTE
jgi:hypothetical protein